jgi:hypothetical protein
VAVKTCSGSNTVTATFSYSAPAITTVTYNSDGSFRIAGTNFGNSISNIAVQVGTDTLSCSILYPHVEITCSNYKGCSGTVYVTVSGQTASKTYSPPAVVLASTSPSTIPTTGGQITVSGSYFGNEPTVSIGGVNCPVTSHSHTAIQCTAPAGVGSHLELAITRCGTNFVSQISYSGPSVTTTTVVEGSESVTLAGSNLGPSGTAGTLSIAGGSDMACVSSAHTSTACTGMVPIGRQDRQATLTVGGQSASFTLTVTSDGEDISSVSPAVMPGDGGPVTVTMTTPDFGDAEVTFGGAEVPINVTEEVITAHIPAGEGCGVHSSEQPAY